FAVGPPGAPASVGAGPSTGTTTLARSSAVIRSGSFSLWVAIVPLGLRCLRIWSRRRRGLRGRRGSGIGNDFRWRQGMVLGEFAKNVHAFSGRDAGCGIDGNRNRNGAREEKPHEQGADEQDREVGKHGGRGACEAPQILVAVVVARVVVFFAT